MSILSDLKSGRNIQAIQAVTDALLADCSTILFKYASFPGSCHAANAEYVLTDIEDSRNKHGEINPYKVFTWARDISKLNYSIAGGRRDNEESDGPVSFAIFENLRNLIQASSIQQGDEAFHNGGHRPCGTPATQETRDA